VPAISQAIAIPTLAPRFHLAGGEAFLRFDHCLTILRAAREAGYLEISATTNGYWGRLPEVAAARCRELYDAGLTTLEISWDHWHRPYIDNEAVSNCLEASREAGIPVILRLLTTRTHDVEEALSTLRPDALDAAAMIFSTTVANTGRAAVEVDPDEIFARGDLSENCHSALSLTINPAGDVFPCCSGLDQTHALCFGNIRRSDIRAIVDAMDRSALLRRIVFEGIASLVPLIEEAGVELHGRHSSICSLCWTIFSRPDCVAALKAQFPCDQFAK